MVILNGGLRLRAVTVTVTVTVTVDVRDCGVLYEGTCDATIPMTWHSLALLVL